MDCNYVGFFTLHCIVLYYLFDSNGFISAMDPHFADGSRSAQLKTGSVEQVRPATLHREAHARHLNIGPRNALLQYKEGTLRCECLGDSEEMPARFWGQARPKIVRVRRFWFAYILFSFDPSPESRGPIEHRALKDILMLTKQNSLLFILSCIIILCILYYVDCLLTVKIINTWYGIAVSLSIIPIWSWLSILDIKKYSYSHEMMHSCIFIVRTG